MPQTSPERRARWQTLERAMEHLSLKGYGLLSDWTWRAPLGYVVTAMDEDAILYCIEEWDFGGVVTEEE